jgi:K+-sensing histidine kinase KdpD
MADQAVLIEHPNREKAASKATKAAVILLLLASAILVAVVTIAGWNVLEGAKGVQVAFIVLYVVMAVFVARWSRGVLPVAASLAIMLFIFAVVSVPGWFARDKPGFADPGLSADVLGLVTILIAALQLLLVAFAMQGFMQSWHVEVEHPSEGPSRAVPAAG